MVAHCCLKTLFEMAEFILKKLVLLRGITVLAFQRSIVLKKLLLLLHDFLKLLAKLNVIHLL